jgi:hypothetical protein
MTQPSPPKRQPTPPKRNATPPAAPSASAALALVDGLPERIWMRILGDFFVVTDMTRLKLVSKSFGGWVRARLADPDSLLVVDSNSAASEVLKICIVPRRIKLQGPRITDAGLSLLLQSGSVNEICIRDCEAVTDASLKVLGAQCHSLRRVELDKRPLSVLHNYSSSRALTVTDAGLQAVLLNGSKTLTDLVLHFCHGVTDASFLNLPVSCPELARLSLTWLGKVSDPTCEYVARLPKLAELDLRTLREVSDKGVMCIAEQCSSLRRVTLLDVAVEDASLIQLGLTAGPRLTHLHLSDLELITDEALLALAKSVGPLLTYLNLSHLTKVTDVGASALFRACTQLQRVELNYLSSVGDASVQVLGESCPRLAVVCMDGLKKVTNVLVLAKLPLLVELECYGADLPAEAVAELDSAKRAGAVVRVKAW